MENNTLNGNFGFNSKNEKLNANLKILKKKIIIYLIIQNF